MKQSRAKQPSGAEAPEPDPIQAQADRVVAAMNAQEGANKDFESAGLQLSRLVLMLEDPAEPLAAAGRAADDWHGEVFRRLLGFLHAAHALRGQIEKMTALSGGTDVLSATPLRSFMEEIRTCMQHRPTPSMALTHFAPPVPRLRVLRMNVSDMISWPNWSESTRRFLHQHQPDLPLLAVVHEYLQAVRMHRLRVVRHFRASFEDILSAAPPCPVMFQIM